MMGKKKKEKRKHRYKQGQIKKKLGKGPGGKIKRSIRGGDTREKKGRGT